MGLKQMDSRPLSQREFVYTYGEASQVAGVRPWDLLRWRRMFSGFPMLPTTRQAIRGWMYRNGLPMVCGRKPSEQARKVVALRSQGLSFSEIGATLNITKQAAHAMWVRYKARVRRQLLRRKL